MGKSKDLATGETRFVNTAGDTMTGDLTIDTNTFHVDVADNKVGIGTTSPSPDYGSDVSLEIKGASSPGLVINDTGQASKYGLHADSNDLKITYGSGALATFQNDGKVGVGTSAPDTPLHVEGPSGSQFVVEATSGNFAQQDFKIGGTQKGAIWVNEATDLMGYYVPSGWGINFYTNATERARINSSGYFGVGVDPAYPFHVYGDRSADFVSEIRNTSSSNPYGQIMRFSNAAPDNNVRHFLYFTDNAAVRFVVDSDGDVKNHDNSYGALSDQRIKESISDATSQWDDIKALKVRKFKLKDDIRQYGDDAKFKIGLVSQEAELVSPNLITENAANSNDIINSSEFGTLYEDGDDIPDGKEVGDVKERKTTVKGIRYSILYMKAVKALQEAMARIETLETKVAALEE